MAAEIKITNPYDNRVIATVPVFGEPDVRAAVERAGQAAPLLALMSAHERAAILYQTATLIEEEADALARLITRESAKPLRLAREEIACAARIFSLAAGEAARLRGQSLELPGPMGSVFPAPVGVVGAVTPFQRPLADAARYLAPALAAGCPLLLKPSLLTPLTALRLTDLLDNTRLPKGAFEIVLGDEEAAGWLAADPRVSAIAFSGKPAAARQVVARAGLRPVLLQLYTSAAAIVDSDADLPHAVALSVAGAFAYSGQMEYCFKRIYVHRSVYDEFRDRFLDATAALAAGNPMQPEVDFGPLISDMAAETVIALANGAIEEGAWLLAGGERDGRMVAPLVLENVDSGMQMMREELSGPVVCLLPVDSLDHTLKAVASPNTQLALFTRDYDRALRIALCAGVASVGINEVPTARVSPEGVHRLVERLTTLKTVVLNTRL